jgi:ABC-type amino acid transport substrate-binding protein
MHPPRTLAPDLLASLGRASLFLFVLLLAGCGPEEPAEGPRDEAAAGADPLDAQADPAIRPLQGSSLSQARAAGEAHLVVHYVPSSGFAYADADGTLTGVTVELMRSFGRWLEEAHGMEVEMSFVGEERWATFYERVRASEGGVFGIGNVTITEPRRDEVDFSPPYMTNVAILMTHEAVPELTSMDAIGETFEGLVGLTYPGTLHQTRIEAIRREHFPEMETVDVTSNDELVGRVASGEGYFGYVDIYNYWRAVEGGAPLRHHPVGDDGSETFGVILPRGSDWTPVLAEFLEADGPLQETEAFRSLLREHLGEELAGLLRPASP